MSRDVVLLYFCILLCHILDQQFALLLGSSPQLAFLYFVFKCPYPTKALEAFTKDTCGNRWCLCKCESLVLQWVACLDHAGWYAAAQTFFTFLSRSRALSKVKVGCQWWISCALNWPGVLLTQAMFVKHHVLLHFIYHLKSLEDWKMRV